jgi:amino acid transporter
MSVTADKQSTDQPGSAGTNRLRRNALGVLGPVALAAAYMGPATSVYFGTFPGLSRAGAALPFSFILVVIGGIFVAMSIAEFSKKLPTAGMSYTYVTRTFGPRAGFVGGWVLLAAYLPLVSLLLAATSILVDDLCDRYLGFGMPWWITVLVFGLVIMLISNSGVRRSIQTVLLFLTLEVVVMLALFATIIIDGGPQGNSLAPFGPGSSLEGMTGIAYGVLWGFWMFFGFESAGTLGEETENPRRNIPRALITSVLVIGIFYVISAYAVVIGFGVDNTEAFTSDDAPWATLGDTFWSPDVAWLLLLTVLNSLFAVMLSGFNATTRVLYAMGRERVLPSALGEIDAKSQAPKRAGYAYMALALGLVLFFGIVWDPLTWWLFAGVLGSVGFMLTYMIICVSVIFFYRRHHPDEFSLLRHGVLPAIGALIMLLPLYGAFFPVPDYPLNLVPYVFVAWLLIGVGYAWYAGRNRPEVLEGMGRVFES